jgi:uncharacterized protein YjiS (DUF1127 family)
MLQQHLVALHNAHGCPAPGCLTKRPFDANLSPCRNGDPAVPAWSAAASAASGPKRRRRRRNMFDTNIARSLRNWAKQNETARALEGMSQRQLEDIGAFEARNAGAMRPFIRGL